MFLIKPFGSIHVSYAASASHKEVAYSHIWLFIPSTDHINVMLVDLGESWIYFKINLEFLFSKFENKNDLNFKSSHACQFIGSNVNGPCKIIEKLTQMNSSTSAISAIRHSVRRLVSGDTWSITPDRYWNHLFATFVERVFDSMQILWFV